MAGPVGFASLGSGTAGGTGGRAVTVTTGTALQAALDGQGANDPLIVTVSGSITPDNSPGLRQVQLTGRSRVTITGASGAVFAGIGLKIMGGSSDIIVSNLAFSKIHLGEADGIGIADASHHIWIDHCEFVSSLDVDVNYYDGQVDIDAGCEYITVSNNYFHDHHKSCLAGQDDGLGGRHYITYHGNWWSNVGSRVPLQRDGWTHHFNNLISDVTGSGCNIRDNGVARIENNHFIRVKNPVLASEESPVHGTWDVRGNLLESCSWVAADGRVIAGAKGSPDMTSTATYDPPYPYTPLAAAAVKAAVMANAGPAKGTPTTPTTPTPPDPPTTPTDPTPPTPPGPAAALSFMAWSVALLGQNTIPAQAAALLLLGDD